MSTEPLSSIFMITGMLKLFLIALMFCFLGMQHSVILAAAPYGLGLNETLLPEYLKGLGYATHAVGKVHVNCTKRILFWKR